MKHLLLLFSICTLISCTPKPDHSDIYDVAYHGALKNMMRKGDVSAKADLRDYQDVEHLYALGAVGQLKGEILILDGEPFISYSRDQDVVIDGTYNHMATLLVYATIADWASFDIPSDVSTGEQLELYIERVAANYGINTDKPFPFLLDGVVRSMDWHVIDWPDGDTEHTHEKHIASGPHGTLTDQDVDILGFYSDSHHAIFTHHTTNMHMHVKTKDNRLSGHLDGVLLGEGMRLRLPEIGDDI